MPVHRARRVPSADVDAEVPDRLGYHQDINPTEQQAEPGGSVHDPAMSPPTTQPRGADNRRSPQRTHMPHTGGSSALRTNTNRHGMLTCT
jgi:hypothetical protein